MPLYCLWVSLLSDLPCGQVGSLLVCTRVICTPIHAYLCACLFIKNHGFTPVPDFSPTPQDSAQPYAFANLCLLQWGETRFTLFSLHLLVRSALLSTADP